jgi:hypothetical protein
MESGQAQTSSGEGIAFDFYDPAFQNDPHAKYLEMLEKCPFRREPDLGWHAVFRHADILEIVRDNENFSVRHGPGTAYANANSVPVLVGADAQDRKPGPRAVPHQPLPDGAGRYADRSRYQDRADVVCREPRSRRVR